MLGRSMKGRHRTVTSYLSATVAMADSNFRLATQHQGHIRSETTSTIKGDRDEVDMIGRSRLPSQTFRSQQLCLKTVLNVLSSVHTAVCAHSNHCSSGVRGRQQSTHRCHKSRNASVPYPIQKINVYFFVLNGMLWDMRQVH